MKPKQKTILAVLAIIALVVIAVTQYTKKESDAAAVDTKPKTGYAAPVLDLPDLQDTAVTVGGPKDKLTLINFWAAWCGPCELEAPELEQSYQKYSDKMVILGINATSQDRERDARQFVEDQKLTFPILMDRDGKAIEQYKVSQFPTTLVVDQTGMIVERINGVITAEDIDRFVEEYANGA
ncbi:TlpA family protein disulfide reductase [Paenibacillus xylaniclasticus]|uniref:TlpA family protein disulfide reductase n=1 Tax=Paenibacillus xylaniclasticus TaxID=588083 RepID=UPI000FD7ADA3|nr:MULTISPECIES: TlpA disulfide reductase family protein [Paenibacillus]GFN30247.1 thioredoxin [Paenibacillus curdlanolyticus]